MHGHGLRTSHLEFFDHPFRYCSKDIFSPNSTYLSNLKFLSSDLTSHASRQFYHNYSSATVALFGDYQCRGDLNATACRRCVATATVNSSQSYCPHSVKAVIWLDECFLRYSNRSFFSLLREEPSMSIYNREYIDVDDVDRFNHIVGSTLNDTVKNASSSHSHVRLFATKEASLGTKTVYTLAQCTRDLSTSNCRKCLRRGAEEIQSCCSGRKGARVLLFSCTLRYELYPFYNGVFLSSYSPPRAVPRSSSPPAPAPEVPPPAQYSPDSNPSPVPPSFSSSPSAPLSPSAAHPSLLSGKGTKITVGMVIGIVVGGYFVLQ